MPPFHDDCSKSVRNFEIWLIVIIYALLLVFAAAVGSQTLKIEEHVPDTLPPGSTYGCTITQEDHFIEVLDATNKKYKQVPLPSEYTMRLFVKKDDKETWTFETIYASEESALADCRRWRETVRKSLHKETK